RPSARSWAGRRGSAGWPSLRFRSGRSVDAERRSLRQLLLVFDQFGDIQTEGFCVAGQLPWGKTAIDGRAEMPANAPLPEAGHLCQCRLVEAVAVHQALQW